MTRAKVVYPSAAGRLNKTEPNKQWLPGRDEVLPLDHSGEPEWMRKARQAPLYTNGHGGKHDAVNGTVARPGLSQ